jgi:hypothetical protein
MSMSFYGGSNVGGAKERVWFSYFKSWYDVGGIAKYYPGCSAQGCVDGAGLCRGMVTHDACVRSNASSQASPSEY